MKKTISLILICCCLIAMHTTALAVGGITITASLSKAEVGDSITVSGTATSDTWISIEGTDADGNILYFSAALSDGSGAYNVTCKVPEMGDGILTLTAGSGSMTASTTVKIYTASVANNSAVGSAGKTEDKGSAGKIGDDSSADKADDNDTDGGTDSAPTSQGNEASETVDGTDAAVPSVTPASSGEGSAAAIKTGSAANPQLHTGSLVMLLFCFLAFLLIGGVILFLCKRKKRK